MRNTFIALHDENGTVLIDATDISCVFTSEGATHIVVKSKDEWGLLVEESVEDVAILIYKALETK